MECKSIIRSVRSALMVMKKKLFNDEESKDGAENIINK